MKRGRKNHGLYDCGTGVFTEIHVTGASAHDAFKNGTRPWLESVWV